MLRHAMTLAEKAEIKLKKYKSLNYDDPSVMQVSAVPHSEEWAVQGKISLSGNTQGNNQIQDVNVPRFNWKANLTCYKCREKMHLT